ncbi:DUF2934 domain-containing protein [Acidicapsa ligni]|uniref:DUF2934 domain-containing protein n=1 Tax=Acidicapsa ligni TaxID=542300 RepID=UPI0021E0E644|nr:DUF2934 domain-containing protein [Acidicapsa ligni]
MNPIRERSMVSNSKKGAAKNKREQPAESPVAVEPAVFHPSHDEVARLAYRFWENEGRSDGDQEHYWHKAEAQLRAIGPS